MTEITDITDKFLQNQTSRHRHGIEPDAFVFSLVFAPFIATLLALTWSSGVGFVASMAVLLGGPLYLILGTPVLFIYLRSRTCNALEVAVLAFATVLIALLLLSVITWVGGLHPNLASLGWTLTWALVFAPIWGAFFGLLYPSLAAIFRACPLEI